MLTPQVEEAKGDIKNPKDEFFIHMVFDKFLNSYQNMQGQPWPPAKENNP